MGGDIGAGGRLRDAWAVADFRVLAVAFLITMLGASVASIAMTVLVFESTRSPLLASLTFAAMFLPYLVSGTLMSSLTDRWPKRRLIVVCNLSRGCAAGSSWRGRCRSS